MTSGLYAVFHDLQRLGVVAFRDIVGEGKLDFALRIGVRSVFGESLEVLLYLGSLLQFRRQHGALDAEEILQGLGHRRAVGVLGNQLLGGGDAAVDQRLPESAFLFVERAVATEAVGLHALHGGDFHEGESGLRVVGILRDIIAVGGEGLIRLPGVGLELGDGLVGVVDLVVLRILLCEGLHKGDHLVVLALLGAKLRADEIAERRWLALRVIRRHLGHRRNAVFLLADGDLGGGLGVKREGRKDGLRVRLYILVEERDGSGVVALLLGADGDPV